MHVSAKADYALRALLEIAAGQPRPVSMAELVERQALPRSFAVSILPELRRAGFVRMRRDGAVGYTLARQAESITVGEVLRVVDGPPVLVRGVPPGELAYPAAAGGLAGLWRRAEAGLSVLLGETSLADLLAGMLAGQAVPS